MPIDEQIPEFDRETRFLLPPSLDEWLPEQHLARFVVGGDRRVGPVGDGEELSGTRSVGYHPALLLGLLVYGYATGVFSSRKLERATYDLWRSGHRGEPASRP